MRTCIFGGTFDPVHNGHLSCAREVRQAMGFDRVIFMPTGEPPHKITRKITSEKDRVEMLKIAIANDSSFEVSEIECNRKSYTYTFDTLKELHENASPDEEFYLIIGADTLAGIFSWYKSEEVFKLCSFVAMKRPGYDEEEYNRNLKKAKDAGAVVYTVNIPQVDVSSTEIRRIAAKGEDISQFVPSEVAAYIRENNIYNIRHAMTFDEIHEDLKLLLSHKRFEHCENVMEECIRLGEIFGENTEKCRIAGLLHDCGKELTLKQYKWMGIKTEFDEDYEGNEVLLHAAAGVILARERYGITDESVLEAIENHITGRPNMDLLSELLFIADYTEKGRIGSQFDDVRKKISEKKLKEAILSECDNTLIYNLKKGNVSICTQMVRTRNWIIEEIKKEVCTK